MTNTETSDRVRAHTDIEVNRQLDEETARCVHRYSQASVEVVSARIDSLEREWDVERTLETNASVIALAGLLVGLATGNRKWFIVPGVVLPFLLQHAVQGWCPPLPVLRRLGIRSREEIDREKYALKALRGDFVDVGRGSRAQAALNAVDR